MPNLGKCLRDVKEGCRTVLSVIDGVVNSADEMMSCSIVERLGRKPK
jgi:hypothetical protein